MGTLNPEMGVRYRHPVTFYVDWAPTHLAYAVGDGPPTTYRWHGRDVLAQFVATRPRGSRVVIETNFEAHDPTARARVVQIAESCGVELLVLPLRVTGREKTRLEYAAGVRVDAKPDVAERTLTRALEWAASAGLDVATVPHGCRPNHPPCAKCREADDHRAVLAIRSCALGGQHLARPKLYPVERTLLQTFQSLRTAGLLHGKDPWVRDLLDFAPPLRELAATHPAEAAFLCTVASGKLPGPRADRLSGYALEPLCVATIAARQSTTRREFDRRIGAYAHGYPSNYRSAFTRRVDVMVRREGRDLNPFFGEEVARAAQLKWRRVARRTSRLIWHLAGGSGLSNPATGTR